MKRQMLVVVGAGILLAMAAANAQTEHWTVPGEIHTTWVGNTFMGGGKYQIAVDGRWVPNKFNDIEVSPGGTVLSGSSYEEAGRTVSLFRDGEVNTAYFMQYGKRGGHVAWGWGTATKAVALFEDDIFVANTNGDLMRFRWEPGKLDSQQFVDQTRYCDGAADERLSKGQKQSGVIAEGLAACQGQVVLLRENGEVLWWDTTGGFEQTGSFTLDGAMDVALTADGTLWAVDGDRVMQISETGGIVRSIDEPGNPTKVDIAPDGRVVVCDNGERQQVLVYDVSAEPRLTKRWGREGGLRAGTPGKVAPDKLYSMRGANLDDEGNLYVAMTIGHSLAAGTCLRSIGPDSDLRWQLWSLPAVDVFDVDPASDGRTLYGPYSIMSFDPDAPEGEHWSVEAITCDPVSEPGRGAGGVVMQRVGGRRLMAISGQTTGGPQLYTFEGPDSHIARRVVDLRGRGGWAWYLDEQGSIWSGDTANPKKTIKRWPVLGWNDDGAPRYNLDEPDTWPLPDGFTGLKRVVYVPQTDTMYVSGYTADVQPVSWGLIGGVLARYDNWVKGDRREKWRMKLPHDSTFKDPAPPKSIAVAGDYVFTAYCRPIRGHTRARLAIYAHRKTDGTLVGKIWSPERFGMVGWVDMKHGLNAYQRDNGQYLLLIEEQYHGKNLVHLWTPPASARTTE